MHEHEPAGAGAGQRALGDPGHERSGDARVDGVAALRQHLRPCLRCELVSRRDRATHASRLDGRGGLSSFAALTRVTPLLREAGLSAAAAAAVAAALVWLGPPGSDLAEHAYQRALFSHDGFALWNNFWYAGRYSFVTYSVLYYPLAALLGIRLLAVATVSTAALAFAVVLWREWGPTARWSSRTFAVVWAGIVLTAAFPFALGAALALLALWALQGRKHWRFALLALLTLAASPLAFLLLTLLLAGLGIARWDDR